MVSKSGVRLRQFLFKRNNVFDSILWSIYSILCRRLHPVLCPGSKMKSLVFLAIFRPKEEPPKSNLKLVQSNSEDQLVMNRPQEAGNLMI